MQLNFRITDFFDFFDCTELFAGLAQIISEIKIIY